MGRDLVMDDSVDAVHTGSDAIRVLFVVDSTFPGEGGAERQARKLAEALKPLNAYVEFVSPRTLPELAINDTVDGFISHRINYPHIRLIGSAIMLIRFAWYLFRRRNDFDAVHVHITRLLAATCVLMRPFTGLPVIAKISGFFEFQGGVLDPAAKNPANQFLRHTLKRIDYVQTISVQTREMLKDAGFTDEQIRFIPNGVDTEQSIRNTSFAPGEVRPDADTLIFGYCGRLRRVKGIEVLMESFAALVKANPERKIKLRVAGGGRALPSLEQRMVDHGVADKVEFLGIIRETDAFYKSLDVYIQPSFAEGLPNSVMEAMVAGLPVLATDVGGNNDLVDDGREGWLFEAGSAEGLTDLMQRCIDEPEMLDQLGQRGRARIVDTYDFDSITDDLLELYRGK